MLTKPQKAPQGAEFFAVCKAIGVDPGTRADPQTAFLYTIARSRCPSCPAKARCREALCRDTSNLGTFAPFCLSRDILSELLHASLPRCA